MPCPSLQFLSNNFSQFSGLNLDLSLAGVRYLVASSVQRDIAKRPIVRAIDRVVQKNVSRRIIIEAKTHCLCFVGFSNGFQSARQSPAASARWYVIHSVHQLLYTSS